MSLLTEHISIETYKPFGDLVDADARRDFVLTNMGTAKRFNRLCNLKNLRPQTASLNVCLFQCSPYARDDVTIKLLERHQFSSQLFVPLSKTERYLAVVALGDSAPDLTTLRAFLIQGARGVSYHPGIWHHPMIALDNPLDFTCFVWEDQTPRDCEVINLAAPLAIKICT